MLNNVEKLEKTLYGAGSFSIKNVVITGSKTAQGSKRNAVWSKTYPSTKYTDKNELTSIHVKTGDYLTFHFNDFDKKINEEIYISYPHMTDMLDFLIASYEMVMDPTTFRGEAVATEHLEDSICSAPLIGGKMLISIPAIITDKDNNNKKGILLYIGNDNAVIPLDENALRTILYILERFDLMTATNQLLLMGMAMESETRGSGNSNNFNNNNTAQTTQTTPGTNNRRSLFQNNNAGNRRPMGAGVNRTQQSTLNRTQQSTTAPVQQPTTTPVVQEQVATQEPTPTNTNTGSSSRLSMSAITARSKEIEADGMEDIVI